MRLGLVLHPARDTSTIIAREIAAGAHDRGFPVVLSPSDAGRVPGLSPWGPGDLGPEDVVVAVGGDGTVLEAARLAREFDAAVVGVNAGNVGFLAEVEPGSITRALDRLAEGDFRISSRMTLDVTLPDGSVVTALNDLVVEKAVSRHVAGIALSVGGEPLVQYRTDALIVATPTGSTAYTFSAGGPLVDPEIDALIVTAVAPHNLFGRPLVFGADTPLAITVVSDREARANVDGRHGADLVPGDRVTVARGVRDTRLIRLSPSNFARTVKEKFRLHDA